MRTRSESIQEVQLYHCLFVFFVCFIFFAMAKKGGPCSTCTWASQGQDELEYRGDTNPDF